MGPTMLRPLSAQNLNAQRPRARHGAASVGRMSISSYVMVFLACLGTLYVGGRLWQDARLQEELAQARRALKSRPLQSRALTVEESMMKIELAEMQKRESMLQILLTEANARGFTSMFASSFKPVTPAGENIFSRRAPAGSNRSRSLGDIGSPPQFLAVIGISTKFVDRALRDAIRNTWLGTGKAAVKKLEVDYGLVFRFIVGHSLNKGDSSDKAIQEENAANGDFLILDEHEEDDHAGAGKLKCFYAAAVKRWDASFYVKMEDDVYVNVPGLAQTLKAYVAKPRLYMGCMKSTEVVVDSTSRWYEPEWENFGEGKMYMRHAAGPMHVVSREVALYLAVAKSLLHEYKHEDVSLGAWMLGLGVQCQDNRLLCCPSAPEDECVKKRNDGTPCAAVYDWHCGGLCEAEKRMSQVHKQCAGVASRAVSG